MLLVVHFTFFFQRKMHFILEHIGERRQSHDLLRTYLLSQAEQESVTSEFESYKVRVHNVLKQQKNKSASQTETEGAKQER